MAEDIQSGKTSRRTVVSSLQSHNQPPTAHNQPPTAHNPPPTAHSQPPTPFSACVLAGGASRRMGQDKALIRIQGESLLQRQLGKIQTLGPAECFISGRMGVDYGIEGIGVLHDTQPDQGPMAGIASALAACQTSRLLVLAVDLVQMTPVWLEKLLSHSSDTSGCAARMDGHWEPLAAVYPKNILPRAQKHLSVGQLALQKLLDEAYSSGQMGLIELRPEERDLFTNLNTPEALNHFNCQP